MSNDYNGKKRSELPDSVFGIPQERKYPMPDEKHTRSAIKLFNHVDPKYEEQLAKAIIKNMRKYEIDGSVVGPNNRLRKYLPKDMIKESSILEGYLKSDKDIYYNKDKFDSGEINLCFITGLSGSGKSTMGRGMSSKDVEHYEMDDVILNDNFTMENFKEYGDLIYSFFKGSGKRFKLIKDDDEHNNKVFKETGVYEREVTKAFVKHAISYAKSHKNKKYVCDGIWIFMFIKPETLKDCAVYIKGTSSVKSAIRATTRDIKNDIKDGYEVGALNAFKMYIRRMKEDIKYAKENQKELKSFRSYFEKQSTNESYIEESSSNKIYHLSQTNLDDKTIQPTVPSNYMTKNGYEDGKTKRVCFATSIDGCLRGLSQKCKGMKLFVHIPDGNYNIYKPSNKEVPDASITGEVWIKKAVKMKCIGQIYVIGDKGKDGIPYKYGDKTAELYDWDWKWIDKFNESVSILPQDTGISTVIFDIGDVLVSANIKDYLVADPEVSNEIVDELLKLWFIDKDEVDDTMDLDTYREIVNKRMGVEFSKYIPKLFQYNVDCVTAFDYTIPMIQDLKDKGYKVYYLSNWSAWTYDLLQEAGKFDFLELMDGGVFSYDVGYMKPDEEIYKILLNKYKINPEEAVFFDDREENIEAANKLGIHGVHFPRHDSSIVYNSLKVMQIAHEIFNISDSFKPCDMPEFITFSPKPALETVCMDIEIIPGASVTQDDDGSVKVKSYNKRYYDYDTVIQSFIEAAKREDFPISIKNGNDRFEYTPSTKEKPYGEVGGVSISKDGFTEETIQEELAKHSIAIENQHMVAKSSMKIIKPVILNNDGYRKRAKNLNLKLRCDLLPVKGPTINIRVLDRYQNCEDPSRAKQLLDDIKESCVTVANKLSGTFRYYVEEVTTDDNGCLNLHIKKMKVVSYNSDNEVMKEEDMEYPDFSIVLDIDSDITTVDIAKTLEESAVQEYGTTGGTIVGSNQPDSVYIVNYMQNNVFSGYKEPKRAICKKGMNQMYTTKNGKAIPVDIDKFKEEASDVSVFKFKGHPVLPYDKIIESASADDDFYLLLTGDTPGYQGILEYDNRFIKEENFLNALEAIVSCTESTITGQENVSKYPYMKVLTESIEGRCWNYYRDINGVFAMNELTRLRTASYDSIDQISESELRLIERGTVYLGE